MLQTNHIIWTIICYIFTLFALLPSIGYFRITKSPDKKDTYVWTTLMRSSLNRTTSLCILLFLLTGICSCGITTDFFCKEKTKSVSVYCAVSPLSRVHRAVQLCWCRGSSPNSSSELLLAFVSLVEGWLLFKETGVLFVLCGETGAKTQIFWCFLVI